MNLSGYRAVTTTPATSASRKGTGSKTARRRRLATPNGTRRAKQAVTAVRQSPSRVRSTDHPRTELVHRDMELINSWRPVCTERTADECWFCLSNPKVTKHLIASIGTETYVTLPKGQVCSTDSSPVPGGGHVLIIPVSSAIYSPASRLRSFPRVLPRLAISDDSQALPLTRSRTTRLCAPSPRISLRPCWRRSRCTRRHSASATSLLGPT